MLMDTASKLPDTAVKRSGGSQDNGCRQTDLEPGSVRRSFYSLHGKRIFDMLGAALLIAVFLPMILVIAAAMLFQYGPVIFSHPRIGRHGQMFGCLKFRTMVPDADRRLDELLARDSAAQQQWQADRKLDPDPRITWTGRFLRRSSLDELPQLFNVLRGEMSLVGPRPITEAELGRYGDAARAYLALRPGITGIWQVSGRNRVSYGARIAMDTDYARTISIIGDLGIILRTVGVVLGGTGK